MDRGAISTTGAHQEGSLRIKPGVCPEHCRVWPRTLQNKKQIPGSVRRKSRAIPSMSPGHPATQQSTRLPSPEGTKQHPPLSSFINFSAPFKHKLRCKTYPKGRSVARHVHSFVFY